MAEGGAVIVCSGGWLAAWGIGVGSGVVLGIGYFEELVFGIVSKPGGVLVAVQYLGYSV